MPSYSPVGWQPGTGPFLYPGLVQMDAGIKSLADAYGDPVNSIAALKALSVSSTPTGSIRQVLGYYAAHDGGGGFFRYNSASVVADNAGTVIAPNSGSGRWERVMVESRVSARIFGAKGDGTTVDTTAINAALTYAAGTIPVALDRGGTFITNAAITLAVPNQELIIDRGSTLKLANATNTSLLQLAAANLRVTGGGTIDGNRANQTNSSGFCVNLSGAATNCEVSNLEIKNAAYAGVRFAESSNNRVIGNYIHDTWIQGIYGASFGGPCDYNLVQGNYVTNTNLGAADGSGIQFVGTSGIVPDTGVYLVGNRVIDNYVNLTASPLGTGIICIELQQGSRSAVVENNVCVGSFMGISLGVNDSTSVTGNTIRAANDFCGIEFAQSRYCTATANTIDGQGVTQWGFSIGQVGAHHQISGNTIVGLANGAGNTSYGVFVNSVTHVNITGNLIYVPNLNSGVRYQDSSHGRVVGNSIRMDAASVAGSGVFITGTTDDTSIADNTFYGATSVVSADPTTSNINFRGNTAINHTNLFNTSAAGPSGTLIFTDNIPATLDTVSQSASSATPVTVNANSTALQNLMSYAVPARLLNGAGRTLRVRGAGLYTTQSAQTPTVTLTIKLGGVTLATFGPTAATTAATSNVPWTFDVLLTTAAAGTTGTIEAHGEFRTRLTGSGTLSVYPDANTAVSSAIDLTAAQTLQVQWTFSTNAATANTATQRQIHAQAGA